MSKSLGNSPDTLTLLDIYGADGVRFGMLSCSPAGGDLVFDAPFEDATQTKVKDESTLCEQGRNFCNKMWNALRLVKGWEVGDSSAEAIQVNAFAARWIQTKFHHSLAEVETLMSQFRLSEAIKVLYSFIWDDFCSWYLEMVKPAFGMKIDAMSYAATLSMFEDLMITLHPFMPFITEEIWHNLRERKEGEDCMMASRIKAQPTNTQGLKDAEIVKDVVSKIRDIRGKNAISPKDALVVQVLQNDRATTLLALDGWKETVMKLANVSALTIGDTEPTNSVAFLSETEKYYVVLNKDIDVAAERERITKELDYLRGFVVSVEKKLSNEKFVANAKEEVVAAERKKLADGISKIQLLEESLGGLN
jgi:valyl-tRNA synthetase